MSGFQREMRFRAQSQVEAYWEGLKQGRAVPSRSDIDPRGIEDALEYAFILEKIAPGLARLRVAGGHMSDVMGMEVRGMPITSFVPPEGRAGFCETLDRVMNGPAKARIEMSAQTGIGKPSLEARMLLLPLMSDFGEITRILGCFESQGRIGRAPRRFNIQRTELIDIDAGNAQTVPHAPAPSRPFGTRGDARQSHAFHEPGAAFQTAGTTGSGKTQETEHPRRPSYLKLIKTDN